MVAILFPLVVLSWGFSWYAIVLQLDAVPVVVAIGWRFALAAVLLGGWLVATGRRRPMPWRSHGGLALLGLCLCSANYLCFYLAARYVPSGLLSVVFALAAVFGVANQRWLFGTPVSPRAVVAGLVGAVGVLCLYAGELDGGADGSSPWVGLGLALVGTQLFSFGSTVSPRIVAAADLPNVVARSMAWGAGLCAVVAVLQGLPLAPSGEPVWVASLVYLALVGSVVAFLAYLRLVALVGAATAAYATVLFPLVALGVSWRLEGYEPGVMTVIGAALALGGAALLFVRRSA